MQKGHFVNNGRPFQIGTKPNSAERPIEVVLSPNLANKYQVVKKEMPGNLPGKWKDNNGNTFTIEWVNSFGLKEVGKPDFVSGQVEEDYEILIGRGTGILVYYLNGVVPFDDNDLSEPDDKSNMIAARMRHGDPPVGWGI
jgi:hypothetical protein